MSFYLGAVYVEAFAILALMISFIFYAYDRIANYGPEKGNEVHFAPMVLFALVLSLVAFSLVIVSFIFIVQCPERTRARGWAIGSVAANSLLALMVVVALCLDGKNPALPTIKLFNFLVFLAGFFCFILFLKRIAAHLDEPFYVKKAQGLLMMPGIILGFYLVSYVGELLYEPNASLNVRGAIGLDAVLMAFGRIGVAVIGLWCGLRYVRLIHRVHGSIPSPGDEDRLK